MDENKMIEIVKFERKENDILVGYRQNGRVVYASVLSNLDDATAKQRAYEQVREALIYEQTLDKPSIDGSEMETIEAFMPAEPVTTIVKIDGPSNVAFEDESADKNVTYKTVAYDQYGSIVSTDKLEKVFNNINSEEVISATIDGITATLNVTVQAYQIPDPSETEELLNYILDVDMRLVMVEMGII